MKQAQDLLGEVHDLDVLAGTIEKVAGEEPEQSREGWRQRIGAERAARLEEYRQMCMGERRLWQEWKDGLPRGNRLEAAALARLGATARALGATHGKAGQVARLGQKLYEKLRKVQSGGAFANNGLRKVFRAAARLHGIGTGLQAKSPQKAARKFLRRLALPVGWTETEWDLLTLVVRYHRGAELQSKDKAYARLGKDEQTALCAMAGVLRLARVLRKCGVQTSKDLQVERSVDALIVRVVGLENTEASAARVAAGKHLLETVLDRPLIVQTTPGLPKIVELPRVEQAFQAASD